MENKDLSHEESLRLIESMIVKAKNSYHDTGIGPILWGSIIAICSLVTYCQLNGYFELPFDIWWLTAIAIIPQIVISVKYGKTNKHKSHDESTMDAIWISFGVSIALLIFININIIDKISPVFQDYVERHGTKAPANYSGFTTSFFLMLYGIPTIITAVLRKFKWMLYGGFLCWIFCVVSVYTDLKTDMLLTAIAAIFAWLIPGMVLWKRHCKRKQSNGI